MIAVFIPAWKEAGVIDKMITNLIEKVDYKNYFVFVGTYPNDKETQAAVDKIAFEHQKIIKVVNPNPGPTNKADCLNYIYYAMKEYEREHNIFFEVIVMHDAEDFVHPYSFLLYNYLIPRVDAIQLPILPLPVPWYKWVHWIYADEFAENHMKDIIVRERMRGFVPFAGVGTGFSRRLFNYLETKKQGEIFDENSLTEDYNLARTAREAGMDTIFVNVVLEDDKSPWYRPLSKRKYFISNWSYFPSDFWRSIKQKTRWIVGISLQEWEKVQWKGNIAIKENFLKDRKGLFSFTANILGYLILIYVLIYIAGQKGIVSFKWEPIIHRGTVLFTMIIIATFFMAIRLLQRIIFVTAVYGIVPGLLSVPRFILGNIINGIASFRAFWIYLQTLNKPRIKWDKTTHLEGAGINPAEETIKRENVPEKAISCIDFIKILATKDIPRIIEAIDNLKHTCSPEEHQQMMDIMESMVSNESLQIRVLTMKMFAKMQCEKLIPFVKRLIFDREWIVRANAAKAIVHSRFLNHILKDVLTSNDRFAKEVLIKTLEQNEWAFYRIGPELKKPDMVEVREEIFKYSKFLQEKFSAGDPMKSSN